MSDGKNQEVNLEKIKQEDFIKTLEAISENHFQADKIINISSELFSEKNYLKTHHPYLYLKFFKIPSFEMHECLESKYFSYEMKTSLVELINSCYYYANIETYKKAPSFVNKVEEFRRIYRIDKIASISYLGKNFYFSFSALRELLIKSEGEDPGHSTSWKDSRYEEFVNLLHKYTKDTFICNYRKIKLEMTDDYKMNYIEDHIGIAHINKFLLSKESDERKIEILKKYRYFISNGIEVISPQYSDVLQKFMLENANVIGYQSVVKILQGLKKHDDKVAFIQRLPKELANSSSVLEYIHAQECPKLSLKEKFELIDPKTCHTVFFVAYLIQHYDEQESKKYINDWLYYNNEYTYKFIVEFYHEKKPDLKKLTLQNKRQIEHFIGLVSESKHNYTKECYKYSLNLAIKIENTQLFFDNLCITSLPIIVKLCLKKNDKNLMDKCLDSIISKDHLFALFKMSKEQVRKLILFYKDDKTQLNKIFKAVDINLLFAILNKQEKISNNFVKAFVSKIYENKNEGLEFISKKLKESPDNIFLKSCINVILGSCQTKEEASTALGHLVSAWPNNTDSFFSKYEHTLPSGFKNTALKFGFIKATEKEKQKLTLLYMVNPQTEIVKRAIRALGGTAAEESFSNENTEKSKETVEQVSIIIDAGLLGSSNLAGQPQQEEGSSLVSYDTISQIKSIKDSGADKSFKSETEQVVGFVHDRDRILKKDEGSFKNGNWYNPNAYGGGYSTISQIKSIKDSGADKSFKSETEGVYKEVHDRDRILKKDEGSFKNGNWYSTISHSSPTGSVQNAEAKKETRGASY